MTDRAKRKSRPSTRQRVLHPASAEPVDPVLEALVRDIIGRVADKWTMLALEALAEHGRLRFTRCGELIGGVSQKMLTKTLRQMEADGLISRTVYPVVPPRVEYELTALGASLGAAFCGVWLWAAEHREAIQQARQAFAARQAGVDGEPAADALPPTPAPPAGKPPAARRIGGSLRG